MLFILFFSFQCWVMFPCYLYIHIYFPSVDCSIIFLVVFYGLYQVFLFELLLVPMLNNVVNALLTTVLYIFNFWFLRSLCFVKFDNYILLSISFRISPFHFFSFVFPSFNRFIFPFVVIYFERMFTKTFISFGFYFIASSHYHQYITFRLGESLLYYSFVQY